MINSKMIVFCNNMLTPYTHRVLESLVREGVNLSVISCVEQEKNRNWKVKTLTYKHIISSGFTCRLGISRYAHFNLGIWKDLSKLNPKAVIINGFYPSMIFAALWARWHRVPLFLSIDGWRLTMPNTLYHRLIRPWIVSCCKGIVCCSLKGKEYFNVDLGYDESKIAIIPLVPAWDSSLNVSPVQERVYDIMWCAHLENSTKNSSFMIDIVRAMKKNNRDIGRWLIIGTGANQSEILAGLKNENLEFEHISSVSWKDIEQYYMKSKLFILPSLWEPWGLVCNEAMQCGTPCIVSSLVGASDEIVVNNKNGYVLPLDPEKWALSIDTLIQDTDKYMQFREESRKIIQERNLDIVVKKWCDWFNTFILVD